MQTTQHYQCSVGKFLDYSLSGGAPPAPGMAQLYIRDVPADYRGTAGLCIDDRSKMVCLNEKVRDEPCIPATRDIGNFSCNFATSEICYIPDVEDACNNMCQNGSTCKPDGTCDCSTAVDVAHDCYGYYGDGDTSSGVRQINLQYSGKYCDVAPAGLPYGFVTDFHSTNHGQCFSNHKDYTNGQNGQCAPGLLHLQCTGDYAGNMQSHICADANYYNNHGGLCGQR